MSTVKGNRLPKTSRSIRNMKDISNGREMESLKQVGSLHRSVMKNTGSFFADAFERFRSTRQTISMTEDRHNKFGVTTIFQYFREDLGGLSCVRFVPEGSGVAVGFYSGDVQVCTPQILDQQAGVQFVQRGWEGGYAISCLKFHPKRGDLLFASSLTGVVAKSDISDDFAVAMDTVVEEGDNEINSFDFDQGGDFMVTGGMDTVLRVYDLNTSALLHVYGNNHNLRSSQRTMNMAVSHGEYHEKRIYCVKCHPEEQRIFITGGWDRSVRIWDTRVREGCVRSIFGPYIFGDSMDISKGKLLTASCVAEDSLELWDLGSGERLRKVVPTNKRAYLYGEYPYTAQFYRGDLSGNTILCGGNDLGGLQVINLNSNAIMYLFEDPKPVVAVDSNSSNIAFGGKSHALAFCRMVLPDEGGDSTDCISSCTTQETVSVSVKLTESTETTQQ